MKKCFIAVLALLAVCSVVAVRGYRVVYAVPASDQLGPIQAGLPAPVEAAMNGIDPARLRAHTKFLADDLLEGRGPDQRGGAIAQLYMATQFALVGLQPGGDDGTYYQKIPMVFMKALPQSQFSFVPQKGDKVDLKLLDDIVVQNENQTEESDVDAPVVFVGYGIDAPEFHWDDYKGVDVKGKVLLMFAGEPKQTLGPNKGLNWYYKWTYKWDEAATKGAVGALLINREDMSSANWLWIQNTHGKGRSYLKYDKTPKVKTAGWIQWEMGRKILAYGGKDLDQLEKVANTPDFHPVPLPVSFKAHIVSQVHRFTASNIIGVIPGSDPQLSKEAVIYTAHWDHLGIIPEMSGDNIYNGAEDNATGSASLIEIARAFQMSPERPKRTILLIADAAEEQGMIGVEHFSQHPTIPDEKIALDLNYDGQAPLGDATQVRIGGAEQTDFLPKAEDIAKQFNMTVAPAGGAGAGCCRSDTFWLNSVGIPTLSMGPSQFANHTAEWLKEYNHDFRENHYHQPSDEYHEDWGLHWKRACGALRLRDRLGSGHGTGNDRLETGRRV